MEREEMSEREAIVSWLRLPRSGRTASLSVRFGIALNGFFRPNKIVEWVNETSADLIEEERHLKDTPNAD